MTTVAEVTDLAGQLPDLIKQVQNGAEILLTQSSKPVARLVPVSQAPEGRKPLPPLEIFAYSRPGVITPNISRAEIAEDLFNRE